MANQVLVLGVLYSAEHVFSIVQTSPEEVKLFVDGNIAGRRPFVPRKKIAQYVEEIVGSEPTLLTKYPPAGEGFVELAKKIGYDGWNARRFKTWEEVVDLLGP